MLFTCAQGFSFLEEDQEEQKPEIEQVEFSAQTEMGMEQKAFSDDSTVPILNNITLVHGFGAITALHYRCNTNGLE